MPIRSPSWAGGAPSAFQGGLPRVSVLAVQGDHSAATARPALRRAKRAVPQGDLATPAGDAGGQQRGKHAVRGGPLGACVPTRSRRLAGGAALGAEGHQSLRLKAPCRRAIRWPANWRTWRANATLTEPRLIGGRRTAHGAIGDVRRESSTMLVSIPPGHLALYMPRGFCDCGPPDDQRHRPHSSAPLSTNLRLSAARGQGSGAGIMPTVGRLRAAVRPGRTALQPTGAGRARPAWRTA